MNIDIDHFALRAAIALISQEISVIKRLLRARWVRPMADEQRALSLLEARATELYALRAFTRGRLHLRKAPRGAPSDWDALTYHQRIAERLGPSYAVTLSESA